MTGPSSGGGRPDRGIASEVARAMEDRAAALPIGSEPLEVTARWVGADVELRGVPAIEALDARIAAHRSISEHLRLWFDAELEVDDGQGWRDAVEVSRELGADLALVTAANPMTVELSAEENERRNGLLEAAHRPPMRSMGRSPDGSWAESGFAMPFGPRAIRAGQEFGQAAIYRISPVGVDVVVLVGAAPDPAPDPVPAPAPDASRHV